MNRIHEAFMNFCEAIIWIALLGFPVCVLFYFFFLVIFGGEQ